MNDTIFLNKLRYPFPSFRLLTRKSSRSNKLTLLLPELNIEMIVILDNLDPAMIMSYFENSKHLNHQISVHSSF
jgi:hypothetical protein